MNEVDVEYVENKDGVHLLHPLYTESSLCGDSVYLFEDDLMTPTSKVLPANVVQKSSKPRKA